MLFNYYFVQNVQHMFEHMAKPKTGLLIAEGTVDVLAESVFLERDVFTILPFSAGIRHLGGDIDLPTQGSVR